MRLLNECFYSEILSLRKTLDPVNAYPVTDTTYDDMDMKNENENANSLLINNTIISNTDNNNNIKETGNDNTKFTSGYTSVGIRAKQKVYTKVQQTQIMNQKRSYFSLS
jgi:hypothetical protein